MMLNEIGMFPNRDVSEMVPKESIEKFVNLTWTQQYIIENDSVEEMVKSNYYFVDNKETKNYHWSNKEKIQKKLLEYYRNISKDEKIKEIMPLIEIKICRLG